MAKQTTQKQDEIENEAKVEKVEDEQKSDLAKVLIEYLNTNNGHEIASKILSQMGKNTERLGKASICQLVIQAVIVIIIIGVTATLSANGKFDASLGVLFGTLVGYVFGKKT